MYSFKLFTGVASNGVLTYISKLYPGSISDKQIVQQSGFLKHFVPGDLILADKGFLIQDIVPKGMAVNISPFLEHGKFFLRDSRACETRARVKITPREKRRHAAGREKNEGPQTKPKLLNKCVALTTQNSDWLFHGNLSIPVKNAPAAINTRHNHNLQNK